MWVGGQHHAPAALPLRNRPSEHCVGGWVGFRAGLDGCRKYPVPSGFDHRIVQPAAISCTDWPLSYVTYVSYRTKLFTLSQENYVHTPVYYLLCIKH